MNQGSTDALMNYFQSEQSFLLKDLLALRPEIIEGLQNGNIIVTNEIFNTDYSAFVFYQNSIAEENLLIALNY